MKADYGFVNTGPACRSMRWALAAGFGIAALIGCSEQSGSPSSKPPAATVEEQKPDPSAEFLAMAARHAGDFLRTAPELASELSVSEETGGAGYLSRLGGYGFEAHQSARAMNEVFLQELRSHDRKSLDASTAITYDILKNAYEAAARRNQFDFGGATPFGASLPNSGANWAVSPYFITQLSGLHIDLPKVLIVDHPMRTRAHAEAFIARLESAPRAIDEAIETVNSDAGIGVTPPDFAINGILNSISGFTAGAVEQNPIIATFNEKLSNIAEVSEDERAILRARAIDAMTTGVIPAYGRLGELYEMLRAEASSDAGVWRLGEEGAAFYQMALTAYGAQSMSGEDIHEIGLAEVARITGEMDALLKSIGIANGSVGERMKRLSERPDNIWPNTDEGRDQLLESLRQQIDSINEIAPRWFGTLPPQPVEVRRIPVYEQDGAPGGYYAGPALDGSRPGIYWINLKDTADNPKHGLRTLTHHEAVPGHHFQISLQRAVANMPLLRNMLSYSEYTEGWALYSEKLAAEMGMYADDPEGDLGRLQAELFRAARLVVDTGLHAKRWSREQAIDYMVATTGESRPSMTREVERYAVIPGQACSYKLGMIAIERMRAESEAALGPDFDIREFHDVVLLDGAMPIPVLQAKVSRWIAAKKGA